MHTASVESVTHVSNNEGWKNISKEFDNYKKLRFTNRAAKLNIAVNRLPYKNAGQSSIPDPDAQENNLHEPRGFSYGGNDFDKANPDTKDNQYDQTVDVSSLLPGDRVSYYVTAVNAKDDVPTESGKLRQSVDWINPVIRFVAPDGMRIARWIYMPDNFDLGTLPRVNRDGSEVPGADPQPVSVAVADSDAVGFTPIGHDKIEAFDTTGETGTITDLAAYPLVPENKELKDEYSQAWRWNVRTSSILRERSPRLAQRR